MSNPARPLGAQTSHGPHLSGTRWEGRERVDVSPQHPKLGKGKGGGVQIVKTLEILK
jgi:hypothetical protein